MSSAVTAEKPTKGARAPRATDINDLSDVLTASGIDLKEEENYLTGSYRPGAGAGATSALPTSSTSHTSLPFSNAFAGGPLTPGTPGLNPLTGSGPLSRPPALQKTIEQELTEKHEAAARAYAESQQAHLSDPFLHSNLLRFRLDKLTKRTGLHLSVDGVREKPTDVPKSIQTAVIIPHTADASGIVSTKASCMVDPHAPLADLITLLSLAARERIRGLLEDSLSFSRGRRCGSDGIIPPEWNDISIGVGESKITTVAPITVTKSSWEIQAGSTKLRKRSHSQSDSVDQPSTIQSKSPTPVPSSSYSSSVAAVLESISASDRKLEEDRISARRKRQKAEAAAAANGTGPAPAEDAEKIIELPIKMTKKERERAAKGALLQTEEAMHKNANITASLALGGGKKKFSWMDGGGFGFGGFGGGGGNSKSKSSAAANNNTDLATGSTPKKNPVVRARQFGKWRERNETNIEMRDYIAALDLDGREKRARMRASILGLSTGPAETSGTGASVGAGAKGTAAKKPSGIDKPT